VAGEIVIGYDGSDGAKAALEKAIDLAGRLQVGLVIVYGYEVSPVGGEVTDFAAALREMGEKTAAEAEVRARAAGLEPTIVVREGDRAEAVAAVASEIGAAMIAVGTRGERPITGAILGSIAHKLLHVSSVPVLVVPI
jgi:nucleotide-binding universal stress UspA family protein